MSVGRQTILIVFMVYAKPYAMYILRSHAAVDGTTFLHWLALIAGGMQSHSPRAPLLLPVGLCLDAGGRRPPVHEDCQGLRQ